MSKTKAKAKPKAKPKAKQQKLEWGLEPSLDAFESLMWRLDQYPNLRSTVVGLEILDCAPHRQRLRNAHRWAVQTVPRLRQRLIDSPSRLPEWVDDPDFDLDKHLDFVKLQDEGSMRQLLDAAQEYAMLPFDDGRPLWSALVFEGLEGGRAAYLLKLHHSLSDGIGIIQLLSFMHSRQRQPSGRTAAAEAEAGKKAKIPGKLAVFGRQLRRELDKAPDRIREISHGIRAGLRKPDDQSYVSKMARYMASLRRVMDPPKIQSSPLLKPRNNLWHFDCMDIPLADFKAAAKSCGATMNDAFVSAIIGAFRRYHLCFDVDLDEIPIVIPISIRSEKDSAGGNHFAAGYLSGPIGEADPVKRMQDIGGQVSRLRQEPAMKATMAIMPVLARLPAPMVAKIMGPKMAANDIQMSNVPGIAEDVYMAGAKITHVYPLPPLPGCPAMVAMVSHGEHCCLGINLDRAAVTEPEVMMRCLRESFDEILALGH
ncbi:MAG: wax ester/triacylglycerol synthase domain-containing protein [Panacagrimonas sp.]